jgi:lipopolysaccharide/colanic/teichoic acid biosynthesis glycosyltransferase
MDTLRERNGSMLRTSPEREAIGHNIDSTHAAVKTPFPAPTLADDNVAVPSSLPIVCDSEDSSRFSSSYTDPLFPQKPVSYAVVKRIFDIVFASCAISVLAVPMVIVALIIKATDRGPIFFKQVRVGKGGRFFHCYKFRSMCVDAEQKKQELMHLNEASGPVFKIKADPRVTPIGVFIRKMSIDEFPQFFNVLKGEMSIVGPRPPIPSEVDQYGDHERRRLAIVPGITCLWQIGGRSNVTFERWVELDLEYMETMSFWGDIAIIAKTIPAVLKSSGAH